MKKLIGITIFLAICTMAGCSSGEDLSIDALKESYPDKFGTPIDDSLSNDEQEALGLPSELPFDVDEVKASTVENETEVLYSSSNADQVTVTTTYNPENTLRETDMQITLDSGAIAGVEEGKASTFFEWYEGEENVIYQVAYSNMDEEVRLEKALEIANSI
ncbi:hypothetical protein [Halobacillus seohaensis]|uniref:DUF4367 domain-containing protein n=1 Tax=Halobacillus seohaensis TaxID=447421 RepID=A0ABW2ERK7_9BACI